MGDTHTIQALNSASLPVTEADLLAHLQTLTQTSTCAKTPGLGPIFGQLQAAVTRQVPYDGLVSDLNKRDAGVWTAEDEANTEQFAKLYQVPVCSEFWRQGDWNGTVAVSQAQPVPGATPATNVYFATQKSVRPDITQAVILHEALHNLTGLSDARLYNLLTGTAKGLGLRHSCVISKVLIDNGCAVGAPQDDLCGEK